MRGKSVACAVVALTGVLAARAELKIGIVGCDTSHTLEFTRDFNVTKPSPVLKDMRVTCAYQWGSRDILSMTNRYPRYLPQLEKMGVRMVSSIRDVVSQVDAVLLETNDGSEHYEQAVEVFKSGKPVFIDKPLANTLADSIRIVRAAEKVGARFFTTSSNRFQPNPRKARQGEFGPIESAVLHAPNQIMVKHGRYTWYGIHGFEILETIMGTGCRSVTVTAGERDDVVACVWEDGRIGVVHFQQTCGEMGGYMLPKQGDEFRSVPIGKDEGYEALVEAIGMFFKTGVRPVEPVESLEVAAMMEAAELSRRRGGVPVTLHEVMSLAKCAADGLDKAK